MGSRAGADYRVMAGPPYWQRRTSSGWHTTKEPTWCKPATMNDVMVLFLSTGGTVYLVRRTEFLAHRYNYPVHPTVIAEGAKSKLWQQFLAYGRMAVTS